MAQRLSRDARLRRERRMVRVPIDMEMLALSLLNPSQTHRIRVTDEVPVDAVFVDAYYAPESRDAFFVFAHELFNIVPAGEMLPVRDTKIEIKTDDNPYE